jgi:ATP/maltotriose-dependent transcriptional regulator MalT
MELIGREVELATFDRRLGALATLRGGAIYLTGEPGIGKTALVSEVLRRAGERGYLTMSGRAAEFEQDAPFGVFVEALERQIGSVALDDTQRELLATVFPALGNAASSHPDDRHRLLRTLRSVLSVITRDRPTVLALDDLHWADPASIDLVCHLLHRGVDGPVLLLLASRPAQSESRLLAALQEAERHGLATPVQLGPLSATEAEVLIGDRMTPADRTALYRETGGNPFYLQQLAGTARGARQLAEVIAGIPPAVTAAVQSEIDAVSPPAKVVLQAASLLGEPFEVDLAAVTAGVARSDALVALDELLSRDLVRPSQDTRRFSFRHPIVRRAVHESAGLGWRLAAHGRAAAALEDRGAPAALLAHHVAQSAGLGDERAIAVLTEAGQETVSRAPASAARWFDSALQLIPETGDTLDRRLALRASRALALCVAGQLDESREAFGLYLGLAPTEPIPGRLEAVALSAMLDELLGRHEQAMRLLEMELSTLEDRSSPSAAELLRELAFVHFIDENWASARELAGQSLAADGGPVAKIGALSVLTLAEYCLGNLDAAARAAAEAAARYDDLFDRRLASHQPGIILWLGWAEICVGRYADAVRHVRRATAISEASGHRHLIVGLLVVTAQALLQQGRIAEVTEVIENAVEAALLSESTLFLSWTMGLKCALEVVRGDLFAAVEFGERAIAGSLTGPFHEGARFHLAEALLELGEPQRCRDLLATPGPPGFPLYQPLWDELMARAELALGKPDRAASSADPRVRALLALRTGDGAGAAEHARRSIARGSAVESVRDRILLGRALVLQGDRGAAVAELQQAHTDLANLGALRYRDEAARELRKLGRTVRHAGTDATEVPIAGLSNRELEVLELVADGKTNREIAEALFLSVRTVDRHLSRIFEKLGVSSRAAAASQFARARGGR